MRLDVRFPIGGMFSIIGAILAVYGVVSSPAMYEKSLGINVNLWWGVVLLAFGIVMLVFAYRAHRESKPNVTDSTSTP
jgi:protein-S-isoprenylcysteine O-methyltransferase Ste14